MMNNNDRISYLQGKVNELIETNTRLKAELAQALATIKESATMLNERSGEVVTLSDDNCTCTTLITHDANDEFCVNNIARAALTALKAEEPKP